MSIFRALKRRSFSSVMLINPRSAVEGGKGFVWEFGYFRGEDAEGSKDQKRTHPYGRWCTTLGPELGRCLVYMTLSSHLTLPV